MDGDQQVRFCGQCKLNVYNLSDITETEAESLFVEREGTVCLRLYRRSDGTVMTKDCPVGVIAKMKSYARRTCAAAAALVTVFAAYIISKDASDRSFSQKVMNAFHDNDERLRSQRAETMQGGVSVAPPRGCSTGNYVRTDDAPATFRQPLSEMGQMVSPIQVEKRRVTE